MCFTYGKKIQLVFLFIWSACSSVAVAYDYTFGAYGPNRVVVGHDLYVQEKSALTEGTRDFIYYYVDGLPTGATVSWPTIETSCCGANKGWQPGGNGGSTMLKINVPATVPVGDYNLTLRAVSGGVTHQVPYTMSVDPVPGPLPKQVISTIPPIPDLSLWESHMIGFGTTYCNRNSIIANGLWEGDGNSVWFYDGIRVYHQIAKYTGNASWYDCAGYVEEVYKPYATNGASGWRVFPHGLYMDYLRSGDATSKAAAIALAINSAFAPTGGGIIAGLDGLQRETAYVVNAYRIAGLLGSPNSTMYARSVDFLLGMIDQRFVSKTEPTLKPFMVGLMMEALIQYYDETKDPRVPPAIKAAADGIWTRAWIPASNAFYYENTNPTSAAPDLNLLIAPAYAWIYKLTGDSLYQQRGDLIFHGGVTGAYLAGGKQFSQNYRWSFDYVNWRMHPDIDPPMIPATLKVTQQ